MHVYRSILKLGIEYTRLSKMIKQKRKWYSYITNILKEFVITEFSIFEVGIKITLQILKKSK